MTNNSIFETKHFYVFRLLIHFARSRTLWLSSFYTIKFVSYLLMTKLNAFHCQSTKCHDSDLIRIIVLGLTIQFEWLWMHEFDFHKSIDFQDIWILFVFLCSTISCVWFITEGERIGLSSPFFGWFQNHVRIPSKMDSINWWTIFFSKKTSPESKVRKGYTKQHMNPNCSMYPFLH